MKKLYYLDEEEKNRILNLHESSTRKQYLMNEGQTGDDIRSGAAAGALYGAAAGATLGVVGAIPGAVIGTAIGAISALFNTTARPDFKKQITDVCNSGKLGQPIDSNQLDTISATLKKLIETRNIMGVGRATQASQTGIKNQLSQIKTIPDFCQLIQRYRENYNADLLDKLSGEFYSDNAWNEYVRLPLMKAVRKTQELSKNAQASSTNTGSAQVPESWKSFPCVPNDKFARKVPNTDNYKIIFKSDRSHIYQSNGEYFIYDKDGKFANPGGGKLYYKCNPDGTINVNDTSSTSAANVSTTGGAPITGMGSVLISPQQVTALRTSAGLTGTGNSLSQQDINDLYALINKLPNKQ